MKKISILALVFVLTAGLMTACRRPSADETTTPGTDYATTGTTATNPTTAPTTVPTTPATMPSPTDSSDATENSGGINTMDPTESMPGKHRRMPRGF